MPKHPSDPKATAPESPAVVVAAAPDPVADASSEPVPEAAVGVLSPSEVVTAALVLVLPLEPVAWWPRADVEEEAAEQNSTAAGRTDSRRVSI